MVYVYQLLFVAVFAFLGYLNTPFHFLQTRFLSAVFGGGFAAILCLVAYKVKRSDLKYIWAGFIGLGSGLFLGTVLYFTSKLFILSLGPSNFFTALFMLGFPITGLFIALGKPNMFVPLNIKEFFRGSSVFTESYLLDTSAIIDGRIVPISKAGFIEGEMVVSQFVLAELQLIADSNDRTKKVRGKRGLEVIEQLKKLTNIHITIINKNVNNAKEVDQKLVLLAKEQNFKIITNDINLSKIAELQDVSVLNVNELAFALKPIVHPGEHLTVTVTKEGKEKKQGIAYLDDGTMVVVDEAKNDIGLTYKIEVTSVLQSTSGKMIFGKKVNYE